MVPTGKSDLKITLDGYANYLMCDGHVTSKKKHESDDGASELWDHTK
jgi:prepilin-type processing-associated H-X9-DG protein